MDQLIYASLSNTHYWYEVVGMLKAPENSNVTGRTKNGIDQSKHACAGLLAKVDQPQAAPTCIFCCCDVLFRFRLFLLSLNPCPSFRRSRICMLHRQPHAVNSCLWTGGFCFFIFLWRCRFFRVSCTIADFFKIESTWYVFLTDGVFSFLFLIVIFTLDFDISLLFEI